MPDAPALAPAPRGKLSKVGAPKPEAPTLAPAPRPSAPKFVAPKLSDSFEVLVFTNPRPVRVRVAILQEGKAIGELWRDRLQKAFDFCDRDGDGFISEKETRFVFSDQGMSQLLANGFYQPGATGAPTLSALDKDGDGKVSFEEFVTYYKRTAEQLMREQPVQPDNAQNVSVTEAIFKMLDANGDGKLTKDEVKAVEKLLATRDADEDECLNMQELAPELYNPAFGGFQQVQVAQPPNGAYPTGASTQMVVLYRSGRIPGTITQQVIKRYDKNGDFELTKAEVGFDDLTFRALDKDGNGTLDGEELDVWRTGAPDLDLTLSLAPKAVDCVAKLSDEKGAAARGFVIKQVENGRVVLHVGRQPIDFWAFAPVAQYSQGTLKQQYAYLFTQAAGGKKYIEEKDLTGPNAVQFQFVRVLFDTADRDGDGKMTKDEFDAYFDLQDSFRNISLSLTPAVQTPTLFQLLDENRDGRLSVRELRTAWTRLVVLEEPGAEVLTKNIIQPSVALRLARTFDRFYIQQAAVQPFNGNPNQVIVPTKGPLWFRKMDRNGDGDVSRTEYVGTKEEFDVIDADHDDLISLTEAEAFDKKMRENSEKEKPSPPKPDPKTEREPLKK
ncbi:EF-hand domain-containing protein [Gemmata sp. G18]|uniref:EF-hand domain-containing protein n=1 Tax=Gemmata palustris TaxID=2822762 RepID=A0ABS5BNW9_9BACT|nr:EF-hand domain-containing protein [Gemmata palustris]MBP3954553.1 EF-hand domain-containing protein [Gemmata palustris]